VALRLDKRFGWEIRVQMVTQKCVKNEQNIKVDGQEKKIHFE